MMAKKLTDSERLLIRQQYDLEQAKKKAQQDAANSGNGSSGMPIYTDADNTWDFGNKDQENRVKRLKKLGGQ
jgi:hypothetical protein